MTNFFNDSNTKPFAIAISILLVILFAFIIWFICDASKPIDHLYAKTTIVQELDEENDMVILRDSNGYTWTFTGIEDWEINDVCSCLMDTKGTPSIYDDEILSTQYEGVIVGWIIK